MCETSARGQLYAETRPGFETLINSSELKILLNTGLFENSSIRRPKPSKITAAVVQTKGEAPLGVVAGPKGMHVHHDTITGDMNNLGAGLLMDVVTLGRALLFDEGTLRLERYGKIVGFERKFFGQEAVDVPKYELLGIDVWSFSKGARIVPAMEKGGICFIGITHEFTPNRSLSKDEPTPRLGKAPVAQKEKSGMYLLAVTPDMLRSLDMDVDAKGVWVVELDTGSKAANAGVNADDVIIEIDRNPVASAMAAVTALGCTGQADPRPEDPAWKGIALYRSS